MLRSSPPISGHAIEARLYAEDPEAGFLPASGRISQLGWPDGVRIDAGIEEGDEVGDRYDPMLAKVIAHGRTRPEAIERLRAALAATSVLGVRTNRRFLRWLLEQPADAGRRDANRHDRKAGPARPADDPAGALAGRCIAAHAGFGRPLGRRLARGRRADRSACATATRSGA